VALLLFFARKSGPTYKGKPLGYWADIAASIETKEKTEEARKAIFALCTNDPAALASELDYDPTPRDRRWSAMLAWLPDLWRNRIMYQLLPDRKGNRAQNAATAIRVLGPSAVPAVPALSNLLFSSNSSIAGQSSWCLLAIGTNGIPP